jgi:hypothetical protein
LSRIFIERDVKKVVGRVESGTSLRFANENLMQACIIQWLMEETV